MSREIWGTKPIEDVKIDDRIRFAITLPATETERASRVAMEGDVVFVEKVGDEIHVSIDGGYVCEREPGVRIGVLVR